MAKQKAENPFGGIPPTQGEPGPNSTFNAAIDLVKAHVSGKDLKPQLSSTEEPQVVRVNRGYKIREDLIN